VSVVSSVVVLDGGRSDAVGRLLASRAAGWARSAFGVDAVVRNAEPGEGFVEVVRDADLLQAPLVIIAPSLPVWPAELAEAALSDLDAGCALAIGPVFDGGLYLLALGGPVPGLDELSEDELGGRHVMNGLIELTVRDELEVGLLRTQRGLRTEADVLAVLADPLTDGELRGLLG
jgi:glycosyltransferase A (GT-A) superfamily protein (DUF2064 family)